MDSNHQVEIMDCVQELFKGLEEDKIYSLLFNVINTENYSVVSLLSRSILVTKKSPVDKLVKILIQNMIIVESKYEVYSNYVLVIQGRIWYSKQDIINEIKAKKYKKDNSNVLISDKDVLEESNRKYN